MYAKKETVQKGVRLLAILLCVLFLFAGCDGEDKPFKQLCDITLHNGGKPVIAGLQESGENSFETETVCITEYETYQRICDQLRASNKIELPKVKEKVFEEHVLLLIVHFLPMYKQYEYQVTDISADQGELFVRAELAEDPKQWGNQQECHQVVLVRLDKELVQDVEKVSVKTERVEKFFRRSSDSVY